MRSYVKDAKGPLDHATDCSLYQICAEQIALRLSQHSNIKLNYDKHNIERIIIERIKEWSSTYIEDVMSKAKIKLKKMFNKEIWRLIQELELHKINLNQQNKYQYDHPIANSFENRLQYSNERFNDDANSSNFK